MLNNSKLFIAKAKQDLANVFAEYIQETPLKKHSECKNVLVIL